MTRLLTCFIILFSLALVNNSANAEDAFMEGFTDIPLMKGLNQIDDAGLSFDTPSGTIVETYVKSDSLTKKKILSFYEKSLTQLGWNKKGGDYIRDKVRLSISVLENGPPIVLRFEARPIGN